MKLNTKILAILIALILLLSVTSIWLYKNLNRSISVAESAQKFNRELQDKYNDLVWAKTKTDTLYKDGKTQVIHKNDFKTITDTLYVEHGKVYGTFKDSINSPELSLQAIITASDLRAIDYTYSVREKIIREQSIVTEHDTLIQVIRKGQLIGLADVGLHSYSAGLQYQTRKRLGFTARYNWYQSDGFISVGVVYRLF